MEVPIGTRRLPNARLRSLLAEAGWTGQALANAVNSAAAETGLALRYDRTTVAHWLAGSRPPKHVAELIAECFSRQLGRCVTVTETGLGSLTHSMATATPGRQEEILATLVELASSAQGRRSVLTGTVYSLAATLLPPFPDCTPTARDTFIDEREQRIGTTHVQAAALMLKLFADHDVAFGGGQTRHALAAYLATDVSVWLRSPASPAVRARLLGVTADLSYLAGFMCFDDGLHGVSQRYYRTAAQLATAAGDPVRYATALRGMSVQAHTLGHRTEALRLAEAAVASVPARGTLHSAFLTGQLAVASAAAGNRQDALRHLTLAERQLARAETADGNIGSYHHAALCHQQAEVLTLHDDLPGAINVLALSLRHRPLGERRSRAITTARLAELRLRAGQVERACADWKRFYDDYPHLQCARVDVAMRSMRARIRPHSRTISAARSLLARSQKGAGSTVRDHSPAGRG